MTKRLVQVISHKADAFFANIMNDHQQELTWDKTYAISVHHDGYERDFQQLWARDGVPRERAASARLLCVSLIEWLRTGADVTVHEHRL